ncbi:MAG TPA: 4a-hydroxytetrahydrobiopterin dehydratase [Actinomycetota bacterium]|nr:4a-hydroxytetrahydrobiopterin dehydratase [Actinomycetota bacterium]
MDTHTAGEYLTQLDPRWTHDGRSLRREMDFSDFLSAFATATAIALLAEQEGHHPDIEVGWGYLRVRLTTHAAKGLTENDFIMAAKIDALRS